jgi:anthranilate synthase/aminodeoxychorismate synthase-like glutamine amidotransferase
MILMIDNYDSFTYNLVQYMGESGAEVRVVRNDAATVEELEAMKPERLMISPGPGDPKQAGISCDAIRAFTGKIPVLGVCLGHQCIGEVYGGRIVRADRIMHGKSSRVHHDGGGVLRGMPNPFEAIRYHSLLVERDSVPEELQVTAETADGEIMGLQHVHHALYGVQFHPESILTFEGKRIIRNFLTT